MISPAVIAAIFDRMIELERRVAELEKDAAEMPVYANLCRYHRAFNLGDGFHPPETCPGCNGEKEVPHIGEYETVTSVRNGVNMRACPLCGGTGVHRRRRAIDEPVVAANRHLAEDK